MFQRILSASEMKRCDSYTIEQIGIPSIELMKRAAAAVACETERRYSNMLHVFIVCGSGNNGGDGFALAEILSHGRAKKITVVFVGDEDGMTDGCAFFKAAAEKRENIDIVKDTDFADATLIVDAIFGIGLSRNIEGKYARIINKMNEARCKKVAVDIPSGINADTGEVMGVAFRANLTVTFAAAKRGQVYYPGVKYCGMIIVCDIGISLDAPDGEKEVFSSFLKAPYAPPKRDPASNKGTYGKVLIIGGAAGMAGAVYFSALAAYRTGAGLVRIFAAEENRTALATLIPEAVLTTYKSGETDETERSLKAALADATVVVTGPGLSKSEDARAILHTVLAECKVPLLLDADALNIIAEEDISLCRDIPVIVTPHMGEMARLTKKSIDELKKKQIGEAFDFAEKQNCICVLKDARTAVSDSARCYLNTSGCSAMSKGGSGDVLTGVIAALVAEGMTPFEAAALGVFLHGKAGEAASAEKGAYSVLARDIANAINPEKCNF